jgi:protein TonB
VRLREEVPVELTELKRLVDAPRPSAPKPVRKSEAPAPRATEPVSSTSTSSSQTPSGPGALVADSSAVGESLAEEYEVGELPVLMNEVKVPYPSEAKRKRIQGNVVFDLVVGSDGSVKSAKALGSPAPELTDAALGAVKRFRFKPARIGDKSVAIQIRYTYRFVLE